MTVPDSSAYLLEYVNGAYAVIHTSFVQRGEPLRRGITVDVGGSKGRIVSNGMFGLLGTSGENEALAELDPGPPYPQPYEQFVAGVLANDQSLIGHRDSKLDWRRPRIVDAIHKSWAEKRWVDVER